MLKLHGLLNYLEYFQFSADILDSLQSPKRQPKTEDLNI